MPPRERGLRLVAVMLLAIHRAAESGGAHRLVDVLEHRALGLLRAVALLHLLGRVAQVRRAPPAQPPRQMDLAAPGLQLLALRQAVQAFGSAGAGASASRSAPHALKS